MQITPKTACGDHPIAMGASLKASTVIIAMAIKFTRKPAFAMVESSTSPVAKATAFGPVAIGSMNAQLAAKATGAAISSSGIPVSNATAPKTGIKAEAVAILLVTSVSASTAAVMRKIRTGVG